MEDNIYRGDEARDRYLTNGGSEGLYNEWSGLTDELGDK